MSKSKTVEKNGDEKNGDDDYPLKRGVIITIFFTTFTGDYHHLITT
jgi:hypothetical protein